MGAHCRGGRHVHHPSRRGHRHHADELGRCARRADGRLGDRGDRILRARVSPNRRAGSGASRGTLLDEAGLLDLLDTGRLRGAALDVFAVEPLPPDHAFWSHPRVLVSPHVSAVTNRFWERETALIVDNIRRYLAGAPLTNVVDLEAGY